MNKIQRRRLLNVARALRESPDPLSFTMGLYFSCGFPACALGHYAARSDLQKTFTFNDSHVVHRTSRQAFISYCDHVITDHFGISKIEAGELFSGEGCGNAETPKQAARFIERFVARKEKENRR